MAIKIKVSFALFNPGHRRQISLSDAASMLSANSERSVTSCRFQPLVDVYISEIIPPQLQYSSPSFHPSHEWG